MKRERPNTAAPRRWMMNSKVLDESIAESLQTLDLMCFSEQYYFLVALISFGMLLVTMGVTTFINTNYNFFGDPVMPVIVVTRRPVTFLRPYAIDATRIHQTRSGVVEISNLSWFGPRRGRVPSATGEI